MIQEKVLYPFSSENYRKRYRIKIKLIVDKRYNYLTLQD